MVWTLVRQVLQMLLLAAAGYALFKEKKISLEGSKTIGNILIYASLPCVIINGFLIERTPEHVTGLLISAAAAAVLLTVSMLVARLVFRRDAIAVFAASFSNPGFFGIPLIVAVLGQSAVFYTACFIAFLNILQWTFGVAVLTGQSPRQGFSVKRLAGAPFVIAILIGLLLFFSGIRLPGVATGCLSSVAALNTPLSMFTIGVYLAQTDLKAMVRRIKVYRVALVRLMATPLLSLLLLSLLPAAFADMKLTLLLAAACPVGANVAVYAQLHGKDYPYAVETVVVSTLLSILTIPAMAWLSSVIW